MCNGIGLGCLEATPSVPRCPRVRICTNLLFCWIADQVLHNRSNSFEENSKLVYGYLEKKKSKNFPFLSLHDKLYPGHLAGRLGKERRKKKNLCTSSSTPPPVLDGLIVQDE